MFFFSSRTCFLQSLILNRFSGFGFWWNSMLPGLMKFLLFITKSAWNSLGEQFLLNHRFWLVGCMFFKFLIGRNNSVPVQRRGIIGWLMYSQLRPFHLCSQSWIGCTFDAVSTNSFIKTYYKSYHSWMIQSFVTLPPGWQSGTWSHDFYASSSFVSICTRGDEKRRTGTGSGSEWVERTEFIITFYLNIPL